MDKDIDYYKVWNSHTGYEEPIKDHVVGQLHGRGFLGEAVSGGLPYGNDDPQGTISSMFYKQLLHTKIPIVQKDSQIISVFLHFWDLCE